MVSETITSLGTFAQAKTTTRVIVRITRINRLWSTCKTSRTQGSQKCCIVAWKTYDKLLAHSSRRRSSSRYSTSSRNVTKKSTYRSKDISTGQTPTSEPIWHGLSTIGREKEIYKRYT